MWKGVPHSSHLKEGDDKMEMEMVFTLSVGDGWGVGTLTVEGGEGGVKEWTLVGVSSTPLVFLGVSTSTFLILSRLP